jgi:hypothetical protein
MVERRRKKRKRSVRCGLWSDEMTRVHSINWIEKEQTESLLEERTKRRRRGRAECEGISQ